MHKLLILSIILLASLSMRAQEIIVDTAQAEDSILYDKVSPGIGFIDKIDSSEISMVDYKIRNNAKRAGMFAALVPGGGQVYNRDYWKLPIVYGLIGTGIGFTIYNSVNLRSTKLEIANRLSGSTSLNPKYELFNINQLQQAKDAYKQDYDMSLLLTSLAYVLQIMEAIAANHLKGFDISPDISQRYTPFSYPHTSIGIGIAFNKSKHK